MAGQWAEEGGEARATIIADPNAALSAMLAGMGSLSFELVGERMRLGVMLNYPEEEHDCCL
jgi:putative iron-regulated protein